MRTGKTTVLSGFLLAALLIAGCVLPEYLMSFDVLTDSQPGGAGTVVVVGYEMENIGRDSLSNAQIVITVDTSGGSFSYVVMAGTLSIGERQTGTANIPVTGTYSAGSARITSAGWDVESS